MSSVIWHRCRNASGCNRQAVRLFDLRALRHVTLLAVLIATMSATARADAATFTVNSTSDSVDASPGDGVCETASGNGVCTLRAAIQEANATTGSNAIVVPSGVYTLTIRGAAEDAAATGDLDITNDVTITGAGATTTIVEACAIVGANTTCIADDRVLHIDPHGAGISVEISGLTIRNGAPQEIAFVFQNGGGILLGATAHLTLIDCNVVNNIAPHARDGGGIFNNAGTLKLIRTTVSGNAATNGGGIANGDGGVVNLTDSTVSDNFAFQGGGIFSGYFDTSGSTRVVLTNSTVSTNNAQTFGGGIFQNRGPLTLTNVTVSGNQAGASGGGIEAMDSPVLINNSTIVANGTNEFGGGLEARGTTTLSNTIVAGNTAPDTQFGTAPDCSGRITSGGYNLIRSTSGCNIVGNAAGNVVGQDPRLGLLAFNGGPTRTHALIDGSPAIDAGNPAVPGGGSTGACALSDQRGYLRPRGATCDIGAFERFGQLSVTGIVPDRGANTGPVVAFVSGNDFAAGATVVLHRAGEADIAATPVTVEDGGSSIAVAFDLSGKAPGPWDVLVSGSDGTRSSLASGFVVADSALPADLWLSIIGRQQIGPAAAAGRITIFFGNRGNSDALGVPLTLVIPRIFSGALLFGVTPPPAQAGQVPTDWTQVPVNTRAPDYYNFNFLLPIIPAGYSGILQLDLKLPVVPGTSTLTMYAFLGNAYLDPALNPATVSEFTTGAQAYAQNSLGVSIPSTLVPQMNLYLANQFQRVIQNGLAAFVDSFGTEVQVYSLNQLSFDLARFGAARTP
jgi:hypothetical protein